MTTPRKQAANTDEVKKEIESLDLLPPEQAASRTDEVLRRMLNRPPEPHAPKSTKKRRKAK